MIRVELEFVGSNSRRYFISNGIQLNHYQGYDHHDQKLELLTNEAHILIDSRRQLRFVPLSMYAPLKRICAKGKRNRQICVSK